MQARLIIKGNKYQAAKAAADRGLGFAFQNEVTHLASNGDSLGVETVGLTEALETVLNAWFLEDATAPYPVGTLLLWTPTYTGRENT
jgi:hypothetical protein